MLFPVQVFGVREYGAALEEGYIDPNCRAARLVTDADDAEKLRCPSCGAVYKSGWRRHVWAETDPSHLHGTPVENLGGFYETIQRYPMRPALDVPGRSSGSTIPHLADFVVDVDREGDFEAAKTAAAGIFDFLDDRAPGQVRLYFSGSKGFHVVVPWQTLGAVAGPGLVMREYRFLASRVHRETGFAPDYKIYSHARMLRKRDTWHPKTGRYKVELLRGEIDDAEMLSMMPRGEINITPPRLAPRLAELYQAAAEEAEEAQERFSGAPKLEFRSSSLGGATPPCMATLLTQGLPYKGSRHEVYLMLARYWQSAGLPADGRDSAMSRGREFALVHDANTDTPQSTRVRDMEDCVRYVYREGWSFQCAGPQSIGLCQDSCPLKQVAAHPLAHLLGLRA